MFAIGLFLVSVGVSLYLWGLVRTAFWIIPTLIYPDISMVVSASLLSFWTLSAFLLPYFAGFFDGRDLPKNRWVLIFISTGILGGSLANPGSLVAVGFCLAIAPVIILLFHLFKHPPSRSLFLPRRFKWVLLSLWIFAGALRLINSGGL